MTWTNLNVISPGSLWFRLAIRVGKYSMVSWPVLKTRGSSVQRSTTATSSSNPSLLVIEIFRSSSVVEQTMGIPGCSEPLASKMLIGGHQQALWSRQTRSIPPKVSLLIRFRCYSFAKIIQRVSLISRSLVKIFQHFAVLQSWVRPWKMKKNYSLPIFPRG